MKKTLKVTMKKKPTLVVSMKKTVKKNYKKMA